MLIYSGAHSVLDQDCGEKIRVEDEVEVRFGLKMACFVISGWRYHHLGRLPGNCGGWPM